MSKSRSPILDELKKRDIIAIVSVGCPRLTAARYTGCSLQRIAATAGRDPAFAEQLRQAEEASEIEFLKNLRQAAMKPQYWRAAAWVLERHHPDRYAARSAGAITVEQMRLLMAGIAEVITEAIPVAKQRQPVLKRIGNLVEQLLPSQRKSPPYDRPDDNED